MQRLLLFVLSLICFSSFPLLLTATSAYTPEELQEIEAAGTYPVILRDVYQEKEKTIYVTVLFPRTVKNDVEKEAIDATDIKIEKNVFATLSDQELIALTHAHAWGTTNGQAIPIVMVTRATVDATNGWHRVTFATAKGTQTTVNVLEMAEKREEQQLTKQEYISFFELSQMYQFIWLLILFMLIPLLILLVLYFMTKKRVTKVENLIYK